MDDIPTLRKKIRRCGGVQRKGSGANNAGVSSRRRRWCYRMIIIEKAEAM